MHIIKPPTPLNKFKEPTLFIAGSIENGAATDWQRVVERELETYDGILLNPRRDNWDPSWDQSIDNPNFKEQVTWELDGQDIADIILMYFAGGTKVPITLLELGLYAKKDNVFVARSESFWRKGNIDVVCARYGIPVFEHYIDALTPIKQRLTEMNNA